MGLILNIVFKFRNISCINSMICIMNFLKTERGSNSLIRLRLASNDLFQQLLVVIL